MCITIAELIDKEISDGIPNDKIVVAGFSMGGALSMYLSYRYKLSLAGCCAMSSFLNKNSFVYQVHMRYKLPYYYFLISTHLTLVFCYHA